MAAPNHGRIGDQNEAYRKGLVLGLTMAEVGILIIFILLLLLVFGELRREGEFSQIEGAKETLQKFQGKEPVAPAELARLKADQETLRQIAQEMGIQVEDSLEDFARLVRVMREAMHASNVKSALVEAKRALEEIKNARGEIQKIVETAQKGNGDSIANRVEQQSFQLANQEGQLKVLENKLAAAGQGKGERPCWVQSDGTNDFLYDVVLTSGGIKMREHIYPHRQHERALLPAPTVDPQEVLSEGVFLARTRPLFQYSQQANCRFFVVVYDATASHEKRLYKSLLRTVEGHFYKRLDNGPAPF